MFSVFSGLVCLLICFLCLLGWSVSGGIFSDMGLSFLGWSIRVFWVDVLGLFFLVGLFVFFGFLLCVVLGFYFLHWSVLCFLSCCALCFLEVRLEFHVDFFNPP